VRVLAQPAIRRCRGRLRFWSLSPRARPWRCPGRPRAAQARWRRSHGKAGEGLCHVALSFEDMKKCSEQRAGRGSGGERAAIAGRLAMRLCRGRPTGGSATWVLRTLLELTGYPGALVCESALKEGLVVNYFGTGMRVWQQIACKRC